MICPVCKRDLAPTLSICLTCGAMMNDTVREELQTKVANVGAAVRTPTPPPAKPQRPAAAPPVMPLAKSMPSPAAEIARKESPHRRPTAEIGPKRTSPTLVGFQSRNPAVPDWRLQLQNSIRQRSGPSPVEITHESSAVNQATAAGVAAAPKIETVAEAAPIHKNPRVANALRRIEDSRKTFLSATNASAQALSAAPRAFPFNVVARGQQTAAIAPQSAVEPAKTLKPKLVSAMRIEKRGLDTNKLPPIAESKISEPEDVAVINAFPGNSDSSKLEIKRDATKSATPTASAVPPKRSEPTDEVIDADDFDDLAPFSMRFGAGVFDAIIGLFATAVLLSPLMLAGGSWLSLSGFLAFAAAFAIVLFVYLTVSVGLNGRTFGMRLFSLEMIDVEANAYPTLHQAAVSASVYILSVAFAGLGFLPVLFNDERRAAHDILSGTILIREL